jgi:uncharacterized membrane protein YbaN (DUF454 family)
MRRKIRSTINYLAVIILIILGIIGVLVPVMPQTIFFLLAVIILSFEIPQFADYLESKMDKDGRIWKIYHTHREKFEKYFK